MAALCRTVDWSATPLGSPDTWPDALRATVRTAIESPFPIALWCGPELTLIYNDAYRAVLGAKHPKALGRAGLEVWAEIRDDLVPMFDAVRRGESVYAEDAKFVMERADGPPADAWFTFGLSAIRDDDGHVIAFLNPATETTKRILAERGAQDAREDAENAERRLREIFAQAPAFIAVLNGPEHRFEFVNSSYLQLIGHRDVIGKSVVEGLPEVAEQGFVDLLDSVYTSNTSFIGRELPVMLQRVSGEPAEARYVDFVYQPLSDVNGSCTGIVAHGNDVTEAVHVRREVERLLHASEESEARYRFLANAIPVQVWTAGSDGQLDYVSDRACQYFGTSAEHLLGSGWAVYLHEKDVSPTIARWQRSLASGEPYEAEFRLRNTATGEYRWHLARATAQRDEDGKIIRWFGTNTDIEDRRRVEAELERLTLEATEANRAKSDFLAAMSHELRTPLNAIGGYAQLIELGVRGPVTDAQVIDLQKIQRSKNHLDALVSDVLNFAKLGVGRVEYRMKQLPVLRTLDAVIEMVSPQALEKQITLSVVPDAAAGDSTPLLVAADEDKIRQILLNLFANALKFTHPNGSITVHVSATASVVTIAVTDTGIGVPADKLDRIFEPFVQADRALNAKEHGVGLGLAISRQLARAMDGDIKVKSTAGEGSTFTLTLPRAVPP
jgi:PAS domain S-box-containing protein